MRRAVCLLALVLAGCSAFLEDSVEVNPKLEGASIHSVSYETLGGETRSFGEYDGKVVLVVNTASECGYTSQYAGLEKLQERFGERGLVVLGFPCNDFGGQEPGSPAEIQAFCSDEFAVTFPLAAKVQVEDGEGQSPVYAFLGGAVGTLPGWNFGKYLVAKDGTPVAFYASNVEPESDELVTAIETELGR
jgi:glutathione peroxidase